MSASKRSAAPPEPAAEARPGRILGTAGHIDHGKTALIRALTGVETDRLPEEKARGITIELGFAPLELEDGTRLGVVDVPGHEGLVRTMVAGATGIDLVLLVVAADEGVMPQTREHLAICQLLGLRRGVVALTKSDLVEEDVLELAAEEVRELLAETGLGEAPLIPVSSVTGAGIAELRAALARVASLPGDGRARRGPPRLWVDRVFEARGFGAVVTGTLLGAPLQVGQEVELFPAALRARVRGLERFGQRSAQLEPGGRTAVNLQGVSHGELSRGMLLSEPDALATSAGFDAEVSWLPHAPPAGPRPFSVELLVGTAACRARLAPIGQPVLAPGSRGLARLHLEGSRLPLLPGDPFVLRGFAASPKAGATLGGGRVLDVQPPHRRRQDPRLRRDLEQLAGGTLPEQLLVHVRRAGFAGRARTDLRRELGLSAAALEQQLAALSDRLLCAGERVLERGALERLMERCQETLRAYHEREPLRPGMPRAALRGALPENVPPPTFDAVLQELEQQGALERVGERVRAPGFTPRLSPRQQALAARLRAEATRAGLEPPTLREWRAALDIPEEELRDLLAHLEREGSLLHIGELWFDRAAVDELRERVVRWLEEHGELPTPAYKELIGTTRKYAVPLMERFDAEHLTVRSGDHRRPGRALRRS